MTGEFPEFSLDRVSTFVKVTLLDISQYVFAKPQLSLNEAFLYIATLRSFRLSFLLLSRHSAEFVLVIVRKTSQFGLKYLFWSS